MNTKQTLVCGFLAVILAFAFVPLSLTGCDDGGDPAHTHDWYWAVTKPATADTEGLETETCRTCGQTNRTRPIPATGGGNPSHTHTWGDWIQTRAPTGTQDGEETRTCATCGETQTRAAAALNHTHVWGAWEQTTIPTCTTASEDTRVCSLNSAHIETRTGVINPNGHNFDSWIPMTPSTCTTTGTETGICAYNTTHTTIRSASINPDAHDWNITYTTISFATVTENGIEVIVCKYNSSHTKDPHISYATGTPGLAFEVIGSAAYRVSAGSVTGGAVHIPAYRLYNGNYLPITEIGEDAFIDNESITAVTFAAESQLQTIGESAFADCTLTSITIPASVTIIGRYAFDCASRLTNITIPASVTTIGDGAFLQCTRLTSITVDDANQNYASHDGILYNKAKTALIQAPGKTSGTVTIPAGVMSIGSDAFSYCTSFTSITIPNSVMSIGRRAFEGCTNLTSLTIPASVTSIGGSAFSDWTSSQTINIAGHANQVAADAAWGWSYYSYEDGGWWEGWRQYCDATIKYWNGSSYQ